MGRKKTTITEIARAAGISPATVSRALNHPELVNSKTAELIQSTIESLNYVPRSGPSDFKQNKLIMINVTEISNLFYDQIISGIVSSAQFHNYHIIISQDQFDSPGEMEYLLTQINSLRSSERRTLPADFAICAPCPMLRIQFGELSLCGY